MISLTPTRPAPDRLDMGMAIIRLSVPLSWVLIAIGLTTLIGGLS